MANSAVVGVLRALLVADTAEFDQAMKRAGDSAKEWSRDLKKIGAEAQAVGRTLTVGITAPLVGLGAAASKLAIDFESSFAGVRKTVDATEQEFAGLEKQFRDLAKTIPVNVNEINKLGESAGALGVPKDKIAAFVEVMAGLGTATNLTADQAATSIARIQNIFGAAGVDTDRFASTLVALGNAGASTEKEIVEMAARIAGAGHTVGLTQAQVLAFSSSLASVGINAEAGGSAMSRVLLKMNDAADKGGAALAGFAKVAGTSAAEFKRAFETDAAGATQKFVEGLGRIQAAGGNLSSTLEPLIGKNIILKDTLLRLAGAGDLMAKDLANANRSWEENNALQEETRKRYETTAAQLTILWNRIQDVGITLGQALLPALKSLMGVLEGFIPLVEGAVKWFTDLPAPVQAAAIALAGVAAAAGPLLMLFGSMSTGLGTLVGAFKTGGIAATAFGGTMTFLAANPIVAVLAGLALLGTAIYVVATAETDLEKEFAASRNTFNQHTADLDVALATYEDLSTKQHLTADETRELDAATRLLAEASGLSKEAFEREAAKSDALTTSLHAQIGAREDLNREALRQAAAGRAQAEKDLNLALKRRQDILDKKAIAGPKVMGGEVVLGPAMEMDVTEQLAQLRSLEQQIAVLTTSYNTAKAAEDELSGATARYNQIQREGREAMAWITKNYPGTTAATKAQTGATGEGADASEKAAKAAAKHAEEIQKFADTMTGKKVAAEVAKLAEALALIKATGAKLDLKEVREEIEKLQKAGAVLTPEMLAIVEAHRAATAAADAHLATLRAQGEAMYRDALLVEQLTREEKELAAAMAALNATEFNQPLLMPKTWAQLTIEMDAAGKEADEALRLLGVGAETAAIAFLDLREVAAGVIADIGGAIGQMFTDFLSGSRKFADDFTALWQGIKQTFKNILGEMLAEFINVMIKRTIIAMAGGKAGYGQALSGLVGIGAQQAGVSAGGTWMGAGGTAAGGVGLTSGTLPGAAAGSGMMALAGPAAGAGVGYAVGNYVGYKTGSKTKGALSGAAAGATTGAIVGSVVPGFGTAVGAVVGGVVGAAAGWHAAVKAGKDINKMRDSFADSVGGMEALGDRLKDLGRYDLWEPFAHGERNIDAFKQALGNVQEVFIAADQKAAGLKAGFDKLGPALQAFGGAAPASLRPMIDELLKSKDLTAEMRGQLQGMTADPTWQAMQEKAEKYGISLTSLGDKFTEAKLTDRALELSRDLGMLADQGATMTDVVSAMADELSELYQRAAASGVKLPETLKPYMEQLVSTGKLVDENGEKVNDLNKVAFADIEDKGLTAVVDVLKEIKDLLAKDLPKAAAEGAAGVRDEFAKKPVRVPVEFDYPDGVSHPHGAAGAGAETPPPEIGLWGGTHGQYVDWGSGTNVTLHDRERVMTAGEAVNGGGTAPLHITVISQLDGKEVARNQVRHLPRTLQLAGL